MLKENVNLENKCGSCKYFRQIGDTAQGECLKKPYHEDVVHDPAHPYICVARTRNRCPMYNSTLQTNADRIRAMSDEELAEFITEWDCHKCAEHKRLDNEPLLRGERCDEQCKKHFVEWLRQPAEDRRE